MTAAGPSGDLTVLRLPSTAAVARRWAEPIAVMTRRAYADSDPVPGLPVPDGARDSAADVAAELRNGTAAWLAVGADGTPAAVIRVRDHGAGGWEISRVATLPSAKRHGVARIVLDEVEHAAATAQVPRIWLNAVIERCLPAFYAGLGYHVVDHWPSPDKALTEVTMQRSPGAPRHPDRCPWDAVARPAGSVLCWYTVGPALWLVIIDGAESILAAVSAAASRLMAADMAGCRLAGCRLAGVDLPGGKIADPRDLLAGLGETDTDVRRVAGDRLSVPCHLMPRAVHPALLAFWRLPPGREIAVPPRR